MENSLPPLLSVCLITYNHVKYIGQAIESVLAQKNDFSWEIIIADDCSTDGTREILIDYRNKYPTLIRLILQKQNLGAAQNWLNLMSLPKSKYIAYLDGDDYWANPMKLQKQIDFLEKNPQYVGSYHDTLVVYEDRTTQPHLFRRSLKFDMSVEDTISTSVPFHPSSFVFRREAFSIPVWIQNVKSGDMAWFSIIAARGFLGKVDGVSSVYRKHDGGITRTAAVLTTYHTDRIELMELLNRYHQFKYNYKVNKVIKYHKRQIRKLSIMDDFINVEFLGSNLDSFFIRTSIKNALDWSLASLHGRLLDAGCGKMPYREYILNNSAVKEYVGLDIETALVYDENVKPDKIWDGKTMPFEDASFDSSIAVEVLEHCPQPEVFLGEVYRVLKPGSAFFFTTPFLWNLHEVPHDEYRYTPFSLERHLRDVGFVDIQIKAAGGWHASLAQMLGLWVRRAPMRNWVREFLSFIFKPVIGRLIKKDEGHSLVFSESQMITNLYGIAKKHAT